MKLYEIKVYTFFILEFFFYEPLCNKSLYSFLPAQGGYRLHGVPPGLGLWGFEDSGEGVI